MVGEIGIAVPRELAAAARERIEEARKDGVLPGEGEDDGELVEEDLA
jgi:hypothetical protein